MCIRPANDYLHSPQGSSCIDLVFVSRHHSHLVDVSVAGSLEKKHQHVSIIFKIVPDIAIHRSKAIRRINPDLQQCSFVPSLFDNMINSNNNPSNEDAGKACAYLHHQMC